MRENYNLKMKNLILLLLLSSLSLAQNSDIVDLTPYEVKAANFTCGSPLSADAAYTIVNWLLS